MKHFHPKKYWRLTKEWLHDFFWYYLIPDRWEIKYHFKKLVGYAPNLRNPQSFNEKIQWLKLNDRNKRYADLIDKFKVKDIVKNILGEEYVIPTLFGPYKDATDIPWNELPNQFVLKCNHDAASVIVCKDKSSLDIANAISKLNSCLKKNYYNNLGKQWGYKHVEPCVFVEQYMQDNQSDDLMDYKFMFFNKECKCLFTCLERKSKTGLKVNFYTTDWKRMPFIRKYPSTKYIEHKPCMLNQMLIIAQKLADYVNNSFVRIDLYNINGKIYFGEFTFYPGGGFEAFYPEKWDYILGSWMKLPIEK